MSGRTPRSRAAARPSSAKSVKKSAEDSAKLNAAFSQRKLTDFRATPSKTKDKPLAAVAKRARDVANDDVDAVVDVSSPEETPKKAKVVHEIVVDDVAEAEAAAAALPERIRRLLDDRAELLAVLKGFDLDVKFGPCIGVSRLERWNRAQKLELEPPQDIRQILLTPQVSKDAELAESLWSSL
ncbi:hypothetical protein HDU87_000834 [Geranomyces variabilis]|uniref:DNA polymerase delta subunit 4 n=1 Tax=Geranomyces variabilis TaxID=109894 RepID=A0AAD5XM63_9FUNG|nr:hypothetical protein HDU87_000834 [Geranomyces variabilis]